MTHTVKPLDYGLDALEPAISARTMEFHHGRHYTGYVNTTNKLIAGTEYAQLPLLETVRRVSGKNDAQSQAIFNNAGQAWNHEFFWECLAPNGGGVPPEPVRKPIEQAFGTLENFHKEFVDKGVKQFGSGWVWLVARNQRLEIVSTPNAQPPQVHGGEPLAVCDVWEHAYYLDYQNERARFLKAYLDNVINWQFVGKRMVETRIGLAA